MSFALMFAATVAVTLIVGLATDSQVYAALTLVVGTIVNFFYHKMKHNKETSTNG